MAQCSRDELKVVLVTGELLRGDGGACVFVFIVTVVLWCKIRTGFW